MNRKQRRLLSSRQHKTEIVCNDRAVLGAARPITKMQRSETCFINGKPLVYLETQRFTVEPNCSEFARDMARSSQRGLRTNWIQKERRDTMK